MYVLHVQSLVRRMVWKHHFTPSSHDLRQQNCLPVPSSGHPWPRHHAVSRDWICCAAVPIIWYPQPHRNQLHKNSSRHPQSLPRKLNYIHKTRSWSRCKSYLSATAVEAELCWCVVRCNRSPSIYNPPLFPNHVSNFTILAIVWGSWSTFPPANEAFLLKVWQSSNKGLQNDIDTSIEL